MWEKIENMALKKEKVGDLNSPTVMYVTCHSVAFLEI